MLKIKLFVSIFMVAVVFSLSCSKDGSGTPPIDCSTVSNKAFAADVNPIIQSSCNIGGCHSAGSSNGPGALTNHAEMFSARSQVREAVRSGRMPQGSSLSAAQKNTIICWIDGGAPNN